MIKSFMHNNMEFDILNSSQQIIKNNKNEELYI